ncbi:MAG TPA: PRC-barrel domain-containing protein [Dehalococcoidia bacterium]|jgi:uncharacterized protein YrrD
MVQESGSRPLTAQVEKGQRVTTSDGQLLGAVKEVTSKQFQVKADRGRDFWLDRQTVIDASEDAITIGITAEELPSHKLANRDADTKEAVSAPTMDTAGMPEEEIARQREVMERQLAAQRERLQHAHASDAASPPKTDGMMGEPVETELAREEHVPVAEVVDRARSDARAQEYMASGKESSMVVREVKELQGMHVLATKEGRDLGTVKEVLFDPERRAVLGLMVASSAYEGSQMFVDREHVHGFGGDAVTVDSEADLEGISSTSHARELVEGGVHLEGVKVLTEGGDSVGKIDKVLLDDSGQIAGYHASSGLLGLGGKHDIAPADVISVGPDAIVVREGAKHAA